MHTYRVNLSVGVPEHCDLEGAKTPFGTRGPVYQLQGLKPGAWKMPPVSVYPDTMQLEHDWQSCSNSLCVKVGWELNHNYAHHQEKGNCTELCRSELWWIPAPARAGTELDLQ